MNSRNHRLFSGFAGVALADILANSVAIIIIMIVVVMMIKHEQEKDKIEQVEEVTVLLSRQIASSVVMNALPTSRPARLHDYNTSLHDVSPQHNRMPILELHKNYVRHYYSGKRYPRDELLLSDNQLDTYLKSLTPRQLNALRVDIYHINLFYIVISILKSHNHYPRHWHFLTYPKGTAPADNDEHGDGNNLAQKDSDEESGPGEGDPQANGSSQDTENGSTEGEIPGEGEEQGSQTPKDVSFSLEIEGDEDYPYNDLAFKPGNGKEFSETEAPSDLPGEDEAKSEQQETSDAVFEALSGMMADQEQTNFQKSGSRIARFRGAGSNNGSGTVNRDDPQLDIESINTGNPIDITIVLRALFAFMEKAQTAVDNNQPYNLAEYNFRKDIVNLIPQLPELRDVHTIAFYYALTHIVNDIPPESKDLLFVKPDNDSRIHGQVLKVPVNERIQLGTLVGNPQWEPTDALPDDVALTTRAGIYPEIYKGLRIPIKEESLILMPEQKSPPYQFSWKIATFVSPQADDFLTAFIYAAFDENGQLLISVEENTIKILEQRVKPHYPVLPLRKETWQILLYGLVAILIGASILRRFKKTA